MVVPGTIKLRYRGSPNSNERYVPASPSMAEHGTSVEMKRTSNEKNVTSDQFS